jgi:hypothetical protein
MSDIDSNDSAIEDDLDDSTLEPGSEAEAEPRTGLTPRQARRLRVVAASVLMAVMATLLVIRIAESTSVLVIGDYGLSLLLCGIVIQLSRNGRTRLGTWLLVAGIAAALATDFLLLP